MADNVEGLVIEIESQAQGAVSQLDMLNERLVELKKVTGASASLATFSKNFRTFTSTFNTENSFAGLNQYTEAMSKLSAMSNFKLNKSGINNLEYIAQVANGLGGEPLNSLERFAIAMERLSAMSGFKFSKTIVTNLQSLSEMAKKLDASSIKNLDSFTSALSRLQVLSEVDTRSMRELSSSMKTFSSATRGATTRGRTFNTVLANIRTKTVVMYTALTRVARGMTKSLSVYGDYVEALNLYKMAMGEAAEEGYNFAETAQRLLGIDLTQWMQAQGVFMALAKGFGVANEKAALMSQNLTQLAYDISSFYNISVEDAIQKVQSGFAGQIRPVRNLGYDLSQARLEAIALANGIDEEVKSMTQAEKSQLRYIALMTQLTEVQGDLARTLDSPTNQLRLLNAQLDQMMRSVGMVLLPLLNKIIPYLNAILRVIKMIADEIAAMFGYTLPRISGGDWSKNISIGADELEEDLEDANGAAEKLKNTLASFDQINLITSKSGGSGSGSGASVGGSDLGIDLPSYDFLGDINENKAQEIAEKMMKSIRPFVDFLKDSIRWVVDNIDTVSQVLTTLAVVTIGKNLVNGLLDVFGVAQKLHNYVSGLSFMVVGFQLSYYGGEDIAKGDWLKGLLKSTIGAAAATIGGAMVLGPAGAVLGFTLSIAFSIFGYLDEKSKQKMKELEQDFFTSFDSYKTSVQQFEDSWNHMLESLYSPEAAEKQSVADKLEENVKNIGKSVEELQNQYLAGTITGSQYSTSLVILYEQMETAVTSHLEAVGQAIDAYLDGPFGRWLISHGRSVEDIKENVKESTVEIVDQIEKNKLALQELDHQLQTGQISFKQYEEKSKQLTRELEDYYKITGQNTEATDAFIEKFKNIAISFDENNFDQVYDTLEQISKSYKETGKSIDKEVAKIKEDFAIFRDNATTDEMRAFYQEQIDLAEQYGKEQHQILKNNYQDVLESFEYTGTVNWEGLVNKDGLDDALSFATEKMLGFDAELEKLYGEAGITRNKTYWTTLMDLTKEYGMSTVEYWGQDMNMSAAREKALKRYQGQFEKFSDNYKLYLFEQKKETRGLTDAEEAAFKKLREQYGITEDALKEMVKNGGNSLRDFGNVTAGMTQDTKDKFGKIVDYVSVGMTSATNEVEAKIRIIGNQIYRDDWCVDPMKSAMIDMANVMSSSSVTSNFSNRTNDMMNGISSNIRNSKDAIQRAYNTALSPTGNTIVDIGISIGEQIKEGMLDSQSDVTSGAQTLVKGMATAFNTFGDKAYDYFMDLGSLGGLVLQGMGLQYGTSQFNNNYKKPRIKGYATGGFPDTADFFYANENGVPEYVGTMGGRTAVANNMEITKGVADGVYKAIRDTGLIGDVRKIAAKDGRVVFAPSEEAGRVMSQSVNMYNGTGGRY